MALSAGDSPEGFVSCKTTRVNLSSLESRQNSISMEKVEHACSTSTAWRRLWKALPFCRVSLTIGHQRQEFVLGGKPQSPRGTGRDFTWSKALFCNIKYSNSRHWRVHGWKRPMATKMTKVSESGLSDW
ncbi:hypothetical protein JCM33374_g1363 [Metschnikowia sp. JCM 33374]|nr:hypothetical protein JCM33374_g1363 [Metschnikowia sp. JCM 33374]